VQTCNLLLILIVLFGKVCWRIFSNMWRRTSWANRKVPGNI